MRKKNESFFQLDHNTKKMTSLFALILAIIIAGTIALPLQVLKAQNMTVKMGNASSSGGNNVTLTGNEVSSGVIANLAKPGYGFQYKVAINGKTIPINYNILQGSLVGILADTTRHSLDVAVNPGPQGGALEIEVPRHVIDSKTSTSTDKPFVVLMDGQRISGEPTGICVGSCPNIANTFKQTQSSNTDRVLTIIFGPDSRFIEIRGNAGTV
jgi:hypothetical protein